MEIAIAAIGIVILALLVVWVCSLKIKGVAKLAVNSALGGIVICLLSAFDILVLPFNLFNAAIIGVLGLPGAAAVIVAAIFL